MKKQFLLIGFAATLAAGLLSFKSTDDNMKGLGRVNKIMGKEVYIMSEPVREYETVDKVNSLFAQALTGSNDIKSTVNAMVDKAVTREKKGKIGAFDAIITEDGNACILIKFK